MNTRSRGRATAIGSKGVSRTGSAGTTGSAGIRSATLNARGNRKGRPPTTLRLDPVEVDDEIISDHHDFDNNQGPHPNLNIDYALARPMVPYEPSLESPQTRHSSINLVSNSGMFSPPAKEPDNPIPFKAALEFLPKKFNGENMPIGRFVSDCLFARDSIAAKDRQYLFLMIRSRIVGNAFDSLQDRDLHSLEELLRHLKDTFTEHRSLSQLNSTIATIAQREGETVQQYGSRVSRILANLIELIEDQNTQEAARFMVKSARDTACDNFILGLKRDLIWRVRINRPKSLQEAINKAKTAEWEVGFESGLNREKKTSESETKIETENFGQSKSHNNTHGRFRPYDSNARVRKFETGRGKGSNLRGRSRGRTSDSDRQNETDNLGAQFEVSCTKCGEDGHFARGCARVFNTKEKNCYTCNQPGHLSFECSKSVGRFRECFNCKRSGHYARDCKERNSEKGKGRITCNYCKKPGHHYDDCFKRQRKMESGRKDKEENLNGK